MERRDFLRLGLTLPLLFLIPRFNIFYFKKKVYLTIDDGPGKYHKEILKILGQENKATFFMLGHKLNDKNKYDLTCRTLEAGHEIGNHSYTHPRFSSISLDEVKIEIERTHQLIDRAYSTVGRTNPCLFRFPYGDLGDKLTEPINENQEFDKKEKISGLLKMLGYTSYRWNVDSEDYRYYLDNDKRISLDRIMGNVKSAGDGDIVLVHDLSITAKNIIPFYVESGKYELVTL